MKNEENAEKTVYARSFAIGVHWQSSIALESFILGVTKVDVSCEVEFLPAVYASTYHRMTFGAQTMNERSQTEIIMSRPREGVTSTEYLSGWTIAMRRSIEIATRL